MVEFEDDIMIKSALSELNEIKPNKHNLEISIKYFQLNFVENFDIDNLINHSFMGKIDSLYIRPILWKMYLGIIPRNQQFDKWIHEVTVQRNMFKEKLKTLGNLKKFSGDPLSSNSGKNGWNCFFQDTDLKKLITLDINRTYQDKELFQNNSIKEMLINILFIWAKDNKEVSYRQGMNEILAVLLLAIYPFYISSDIATNNPFSLKEKIKKMWDEKDFKSISREIYTFLNCEFNLEADLYILFSAIMNRGIINLYSSENDEKRKNEDFSRKKKELFQIQYVDGIPMKIDNLDRKKETSPLQIRCNKIFKDYLKIVDFTLYNYLVDIDIDPTIILVRWLKCLFNREYALDNVIIIWDVIFAYDLKEFYDHPNNESEQTFNLNMIDYISVAMLIFIKEDLLKKEHEECLKRLFKFPSVKSPMNIIKAAFDVKNKIYAKIRKLMEKKRNKSEYDIISSINSEEFNNTSYFKTRESINSIKSNKYDVVNKVLTIIDKYKHSIEEKDLLEINYLLNNI